MASKLLRGSEERDEASDHDPLGLKTTKQLVARQPRRGVTETGGGRRRTGEEGEPDQERRRGADEEEAWIFYMRSAREEGNVDNAARDNGGRHLHGSLVLVRLKNLLMVKVSLTTD